MTGSLHTFSAIPSECQMKELCFKWPRSARYGPAVLLLSNNGRLRNGLPDRPSVVVDKTFYVHTVHAEQLKAMIPAWPSRQSRVFPK